MLILLFVSSALLSIQAKADKVTCNVELVNTRNDTIIKTFPYRANIYICRPAMQDCENYLSDREYRNPKYNKSGHIVCKQRPLQTKEVKCESIHSQYKTCSVPFLMPSPVIEVQLLDKISHSACRLNHSFGFIGTQIWVDKGCRGVFEVTAENDQWEIY